MMKWDNFIIFFLNVQMSKVLAISKLLNKISIEQDIDGLIWPDDPPSLV